MLYTCLDLGSLPNPTPPLPFPDAIPYAMLTLPATCLAVISFHQSVRCVFGRMITLPVWPFPILPQPVTAAVAWHNVVAGWLMSWLLLILFFASFSHLPPPRFMTCRLFASK